MSVQKMDYDQAEEMIRILNASAGQLDDLGGEMRQIAERLDGGVLVGRAGTAFSDALRDRFVPAINRLAEKLREQAQYVQTEKDDMMEAETRNANRF